MTTPSEPGRDRSNPITAGPVAGRCYPGGCTWFDIRSFHVVRETEDGALIRVSIREGESTHANDADAPRSSRGVRITWQPYDDNSYMFCSRKLPAMISRADDGSFEAHRMNLIDGGVPEEVITTQYTHVCHPGGQLNGEGAAARLGYRSPTGEREFTLRNPEDIFARLPR
jgi:hypothetical protein